MCEFNMWFRIFMSVFVCVVSDAFLLISGGPVMCCSVNYSYQLPADGTPGAPMDYDSEIIRLSEFDL